MIISVLRRVSNRHTLCLPAQTQHTYRPCQRRTVQQSDIEVLPDGWPRPKHQIMEPLGRKRSKSVQRTRLRSTRIRHASPPLPPLLRKADPTSPHSAPDNASFASCGGDKAVLIWDVSSGTVTRRLQGHFGKVNVVKYAGGGGGAKDGAGNVLVSGSFDSKVMLWDMRSVPTLS